MRWPDRATINLPEPSLVFYWSFRHFLKSHLKCSCDFIISYSHSPVNTSKIFFLFILENKTIGLGNLDNRPHSPCWPWRQPAHVLYRSATKTYHGSRQKESRLFHWARILQECTVNEINSKELQISPPRGETMAAKGQCPQESLQVPWRIVSFSVNRRDLMPTHYLLTARIRIFKQYTIDRFSCYSGCSSLGVPLSPFGPAQARNSAS